MTQDIADRLVTISHSEIKGFVQQNFGSVTFVYNFPQGVDTGAAVKAAAEEAAAPPCPYRGLSVFQPEDARFFFGRAAAIDRVNRLVERGRLTAVTGASGSGKSSLVFAGVVPALAADKQWLFATFRPGADPFHALAGALVPVLTAAPETDAALEADAAPEAKAAPAAGQAQAIADLAAALRDDEKKLLATLQEINRLRPGRRLLLIADQFEELFTLCQQPEVRKQFLERLLAATADPATAFLRVLLTVRADFLGALVSHPGLADALQNQIDLLGPMTRAELTAAVVKPAELMGVRYEDLLVARILDDLGDDDGSLPLLEFALTQLWEKQSADRILTHTDYEEIGRVSGAIQQHAEAAYARLDAQERDLTRRLFRRLVSLTGSDGQSERTTRRRVELQSLDAATQALAKGELANRRLVVVSHVADQRDTVEIVHETLLANWPELAGWIKEDRETILRLQQLSLAAAAYAQAGKNPDLLYRGKQLREYAGWAAAHSDELTEMERAFLDDSRRYQRQRSLIQYSGYALTALVAAAAVAWFLWLRPTAEMKVPMPAEDFNLAVADFTVEGLEEISDPEIAAALARDAQAVAGRFAESLRARAAEFAGTLDDGTEVNILPPDHSALAEFDAQNVAQKAQELRANVLIYGALRLVDDRYWSISPRFYISSVATQDRAAAIMDEAGLVAPVSYIRGLASSRDAAVDQLALSLEILFALHQGLDFYDQGTVSGDKQAATIFCTAADKLEASGASKGVDLLFLFCGHAYSELLLLEEDVAQDVKQDYQEQAIRAYRQAVKLNPDSLRSVISLAAMLVMVYKPESSCTESNVERLAEARSILETAEAAVNTTATLREATLLGYLLNRGHVLFWLGTCPDQGRIDLDRLEEYWQTARSFYLQAIEVAGRAHDERADIIDFSAAEAHAQLATMNLFAFEYRSYGMKVFNEETTELLANAVDRFDRSLVLLAPYQSEPRNAKFARTIALNAIYAFCTAGQAELAHKHMAAYGALTNGWPNEEIAAGVDLLKPGLRKECGL